MSKSNYTEIRIGEGAREPRLVPKFRQNKNGLARTEGALNDCIPPHQTNGRVRGYRGKATNPNRRWEDEYLAPGLRRK